MNRDYSFGSDAYREGYRLDDWWAEFNWVEQFFLRVLFGYKRIPKETENPK